MQYRVFLALLALSLVAHASLFSHYQHNSDHSQLARRFADTSLKKRCKPRDTPSQVVPSSSSTHSTPTKTPAQPAKAKTTSTSVHHTTPSSPAPKPAPSQSSNNNNPVNSVASGLLQVTSPVCGPSGATKEITTSSGPNGAENFLNCGINGKGWQPPQVTMDQLVVVDLNEAIKDPKTPFNPCKPYLSLFNKYADEFGIHAILLASIAMQESSCNPSAVGGAGEQGLMQLSKDKCGDAPGGNCQDPDFNIKTGASFFADTLKNNEGNVLLTFGQYNGWSRMMTIAQATAAAHTSCCKCQNNLDYIFQNLNGWAQNIDPRERRMGLYQNLANCD